MAVFFTLFKLTTYICILSKEYPRWFLTELKDSSYETQLDPSNNIVKVLLKFSSLQMDPGDTEHAVEYMTMLYDRLLEYFLTSMFILKKLYIILVYTSHQLRKDMGEAGKRRFSAFFELNIMVRHTTIHKRKINILL